MSVSGKLLVRVWAGKMNLSKPRVKLALPDPKGRPYMSTRKVIFPQYCAVALPGSLAS